MKHPRVYQIFVHHLRGSTNLGNTPVIIKYPFWQFVKNNNKAVYVCINYGEAFCPKEIEDRSICIDGDIGAIFKKCVQAHTSRAMP